MTPREAVFAALMDRLQGVPGLVTVSRRLQHWNDTPPTQQPALFVQQSGETVIRQPRQPAKRTTNCNLIIYFRIDNNAMPGAVINPILDAIEAAFAPDDPIQNICTLGGVVDACRIEGAIQVDEGTLDNQGVASVPIHIVSTAT